MAVKIKLIMAAIKKTKEEIEESMLIICEHIVNEKASLRSALNLDGTPSNATFFKWIKEDKIKAKQYAHACNVRADIIFDEILDIADDGSNDFMENSRGEEVLNSEHIQRSKLRVDARKWALSKMNPKKYGDKLDVTTGDEKLNERPSFVFVNKEHD